jgi:peptide/nickel transport system substrate-binding protein
MNRLVHLGIAAAALCLATASLEAKTLRIAESGDIAALDPHSMTESNTIGFLHHLFEPLVRYNKELKIEPALAESWEIVDGTTWRFHLRKGVTFHNGNAFTADDVVASITRAVDPSSPVKSNLPGVNEAKKVDDHTVDLLLSGTDPILLNYLTNIYILDQEWMSEHDALMPSDIRKGKENYAVNNANGTGPFKLESRQPDAKTVLVVNENWWDTPVHNLTRIEFTPIASDATRVAAILSGELDFMHPSPLQDAQRLERADGVSVLEAPALRTIMLGFNYGDELHNSNIKGKNPLADARVRKALYQAIDMDLIQAKIMRGKSRNAGLLVAPEVPGYDHSLNGRFPYDAEAAKKLLAGAGYGDGFETGFDCPNDRYVNDEEICQAITAMWAKVGVTAHLTAQTKGKHFEKVLGGGSDIFMVGWATLPMLDSYSPISAILTTPEGKMGAWNPGRYSNGRIDELTQMIAVELDSEKRRGMMTEALKIAKDEVALIPLHQQPLSWAVRDGVTVVQTADNKPRLWYARVE